MWHPGYLNHEQAGEILWPNLLQVSQQHQARPHYMWIYHVRAANADYVDGLESQQEWEQKLSNVDGLDSVGHMKHEVAEMKLEVSVMKQRLDMGLGEIWNLNMQMSELKKRVCVEKKSVDQGWFAIAAAVCFGVFVGMVVSMFCK